MPRSRQEERISNGFHQVGLGIADNPKALAELQRAQQRQQARDPPATGKKQEKSFSDLLKPTPPGKR